MTETSNTEADDRSIGSQLSLKRETSRNSPEVRDAASVVLFRNVGTNPEVLLGQRCAHAAFMPNKYVFPGGGVEPRDFEVAVEGQPDEISMQRLALRSGLGSVRPLLACAIRELGEETGIWLVGQKSDNNLESSQREKSVRDNDGSSIGNAGGLTFFFRAITPLGNTRRFDARFFLGNAESLSIAGDPDDFSRASGELRKLRWTPLPEARLYDLAPITKLVLDAGSVAVTSGLPPKRVPFLYTNNGARMREHL